MSNRSLKLTIALFAGAVFSSLVDAQEIERSSVNFNSGVLYSWPAYVALPGGTAFCIGELITNRPFTMASRTTVRTVSRGNTDSSASTYTNSVNVLLRPAPGGC
ncbi:MAG: hypothetical protein P8J33_03850 [Pirellulaceae bacterium]|nr:hypothetical protein [Pirellulaceae bacterium]